MTTASQWVDRARKYLLGSIVPEQNKLAADYTAGAGTLTFTYDLGGITKGTRLSIGLNEFVVWDTQPTAKTVTVDGGQGGSTDTDATSGTIVKVRPRFTDFELFTALNEELAGLSSPQNGLFQIKTLDLTYNPVIQGYDVTASDILDIYDVRYQTPGPDKSWPRLPSYKWELQRSSLTSDFADSTALQVKDDLWPGYDVRILYRAPYGTFTALTDDTSTTGVSAQAGDIPPLGAAIRLMAGQEISRNFTDTQPDTRRATEVPSGARFNSYRGLLIQHAARISEEAARLAAQYPVRRA